MNRFTRILLLDVCTVVVIACAVALGLLRSGRPLFYTDGATSYRADTLADRSMLVWEPPAGEGFELPGPVQGRVARLPDGRLCYGRVLDDGTTDLVAFDPARPDLEPLPLAGVNAPRAHDFAPACGPHGDLYFASDRTGGEGGFDLYRAQLVDGRYGRPEPLPAPLCNTAADEVDPAPAPRDRRLAFVRRDADRAVLFGVDLERPAAGGAERLFGDREAAAGRLDRDPVFAPDGTALWFVRQERGLPRRSRLGRGHAHLEPRR